MILPCPECNARYLVPASAFAEGGRQVRCAKCGHVWAADLPSEVAAALASVMPEVQAEAKPEQASAASPLAHPHSRVHDFLALWHDPRFHKLHYAGWSVAILIPLLLLVLLLGRQAIVGHWPATESLYNSVGISINHVGDGLSLQQVRSERQYDGVGMVLVVDGEIHNDTAVIQQIPDILASSLGPDGKVTQSWRIPAPAATLAPGASVPFQYTAPAHKGAVAEVNLNFAGPDDER
jgi:predicted Zn finger-like uncharacterized protein